MEEVCSNRQRPSYGGEGGLQNCHITFIVDKKASSLFFSIYGICGGMGLIENIMRGGEEEVGRKRQNTVI